MSAAVELALQKVQQLSPKQQDQVAAFINSLMEETQRAERRPANGDQACNSQPEAANPPSQPDRQSPRKRGLKFDWADGPSDPPEPLTSVELQHQALEWGIEAAEKGFGRQDEAAA